MLYGLYQSAAGMMTSEYRQDVVANNLANASTPGFKQDIASLMERPLESEVSGRPGIFHPLWSEMTGGTFAAPTMTNFGNGRLEQTEQDLDLALQGDGFFTVKDGEETRYTRDGRMAMGVDGSLILQSNGAAVLDNAGEPIVLKSGVKAQIKGDGRIMQGGEEVAQLGVVSFEDPQRLLKMGSNEYAAKDEQPNPSAARVKQGYIEASNVSASRSLVQMLEVTRAYELNAGMLKLQNDTLGRAVNDIARV